MTLRYRGVPPSARAEAGYLIAVSLRPPTSLGVEFLAQARRETQRSWPRIAEEIAAGRGHRKRPTSAHECLEIQRRPALALPTHAPNPPLAAKEKACGHSSACPPM